MVPNSAPPRRKSCGECVKAKRRCDLVFPACSRCSRQNLACNYPRRPFRQNHGVASPRPNSVQIELPEFEWPAPYPQLQYATDFTVEDDPNAMEFEPGISIEDNLNTNAFPMNASEDDQSQDLVRLLNPTRELIAPRIQPFDRISGIIASRLQFGIDRLKKAPRTMVLENQTPWCHPKLYRDGMPRSMQDAHACCALYMAKTNVNAEVILRSIESRIGDLLSSPEPSSALEALSRTQALILYHIICAFDGDIRSRAVSEMIKPALKTAAMSLLQHIHFPDPLVPDRLPTQPLESLMEFWPSWLHEESARRTMIISFYFIQVYNILKGETNLQCDGRLGLSSMWYLSEPLWGAQNALDFAIVWKENRHFIVRDVNFTEVLQNARPEIVDTFGKMMITSLIGIDQARAWFYIRGGTL